MHDDQEISLRSSDKSFYNSKNIAGTTGRKKSGPPSLQSENAKTWKAPHPALWEILLSPDGHQVPDNVVFSPKFYPTWCSVRWCGKGHEKRYMDLNTSQSKGRWGTSDIEIEDLAVAHDEKVLKIRTEEDQNKYGKRSKQEANTFSLEANQRERMKTYRSRRIRPGRHRLGNYEVTNSRNFIPPHFAPPRITQSKGIKFIHLRRQSLGDRACLESPVGSYGERGMLGSADRDGDKIYMRDDDLDVGVT